MKNLMRTFYQIRGGTCAGREQNDENKADVVNSDD